MSELHDPMPQDQRPSDPTHFLPETALDALARAVIGRLARAPQPMVRPREIEGFCAMLIAGDIDNARDWLTSSKDGEARNLNVMRQMIGRAAAYLGDLWDRDKIGFWDVTMACGVLMTLLRDLRDVAPLVPWRGGREALFATAPGEEHVLGISMAADQFRDAGWRIDLHLNLDEESLVNTVKNGGYSIVGLGASSQSEVAALTHACTALRYASPHTLLFIGGEIVSHLPGIGRKLRADASAYRITDALIRMELLWQEVNGRRNAP